MPSSYPALSEVTRETVTTAEAAYFVNRTAQTLRVWTCRQTEGVPRPLKLNGRLAWRVADLKKFLNGELK